ncbi:hypothetical protein Pcinc_000505 [Petrolisthes cinctipes]|uniref:Uncharacterized protein n=1 Tax=Petrolisthes cinctipes TaxID=88211 RepID=A0AAE1L5D5_PETCI|nr:hypothetical protein Pcinc_000505 [Petrolisthes cinctipes]
MAPVITDINPNSLKGLNKDNNNICTLEATVITGLEDIAGDECREKLGVEAVLARGRVFIDVHVSQVPQVLKFRSVDNINE